MEVLGRANLYRSLLQDENARISREIRQIAELNEWILREIEPLFLREDNARDKERRFSESIHSIVYEGNNRKDTIQISNYDKLLKVLREIESSKKKIPNKFNALIKALSDFNDGVIDEIIEQKRSIFEEDSFDYEEYKEGGYKIFLEKIIQKRNKYSCLMHMKINFIL